MTGLMFKTVNTSIKRSNLKRKDDELMSSIVFDNKKSLLGSVLIALI